MAKIPGNNTASMFRLKKHVKWYLAVVKVLTERRRPNQGIILCFHGFHKSLRVENTIFQTSKHELDLTIRSLKRFFRFVSLEKTLNTVKTGIKNRPPAAITIDDGFSSILQVMDVFKKHNIAPTVFICPDLINQETVPFPEIVRIALLITRKSVVRLPDHTPLGINYFKDRVKVGSLMIEHFKKIHPDRLKERMDEFLIHLSLTMDDVKAHPLYDPLLNWSQIESMLGDIEIGSHTCNHYHLPSLLASEAMNEITQSKRIIEQELNCACPSFCYPFGDNKSFGEREMRFVRESGYRSAFSLEPGFLSPERPKACLPRFNGITQLAKYYSF